MVVDLTEMTDISQTEKLEESSQSRCLYDVHSHNVNELSTEFTSSNAASVNHIGL